jgi:phosphopantetheine--protein transferase-like protein
LLTLQVNGCKVVSLPSIFSKIVYWFLYPYQYKVFCPRPQAVLSVKRAADYFFSLSHCEEVVAVAISRKPVGLDVEKVSDRMEKIKDKILTQREFTRYEEREDKSLYLAEKWTQKESIFKMQGGKAFIPNKIETEDYKTHTARLKDLDGYLFSVAADEVKLVRTYQNVDVGYLL